jgi:adenylosuccinate lyase
MTGWSFGSKIYCGAWTTAEMQALFDDAPRTRKWIELLVVLAELQAEYGLIPQEAAQDIRTTCASLDVDDAFLAECRAGYEATAHSTAGLISAVGRRCAASGREWFYFGATVQDIADTWLMLALRDARRLLTADLERAITACEKLCRRHRDTIMAGRTHGQQGLPITFGFKAASWLGELYRHRGRILETAARMDVGQLCGGVGSLSALGPQALALQRRFFARFGLRAPETSWTASRDRYAEWAQLLALIAATADRIGHEIYNLQRDEIAELREASLLHGVGSITMPHKRNPETAEHLGALARVVRANASLLLESLVHDHERDGRSWKVEWHAIPELTMAAGKALSLLAPLLENLEVDAKRMRGNLMANGGFALSEGVMLALARRIGKAAAHRRILSLAAAARQQGVAFADAVARDELIRMHLAEDEIARLLDPAAQIGQCLALVDALLSARDSP